MAIDTRGVRELVHFTTNHGVLGVLYTAYLKSRARLEGDHLVEHLFKPNAAFRKDVKYLDHISLSLDTINHHYFNTSSKSHKDEDIFWIILAFDPELISHEGVEFATTNNIYTGVKRGSGAAAYDELFAQRIVRWIGNEVERPVTLPASVPTCEQAEVLYPGEIATKFLRRIYTRTELEKSEVIGFLKGTFHDQVEVLVEPERFERRGR